MFKQRRPFGRCQCQRRPCQCNQPMKEIVYPVQSNVVHKCSEETVKHIHPMHTTVMNHHLTKNEHLYPHTTSVDNVYQEIDVYGNTGPGAAQGPNQVAGAMMPGPGYGYNHHKAKHCPKHAHKHCHNHRRKYR